MLDAGPSLLTCGSSSVSLLHSFFEVCTSSTVKAVHCNGSFGQERQESGPPMEHADACVLAFGGW